MEEGKMIPEAYKAGQNIRKVLTSNNKKAEINTIVYKLQQAKNSKYDLCQEYLLCCCTNNILNDNDFIMHMLGDELNPHDVSINLCLGLMSVDTERISFVNAAKKWGIDRSTIQRAKDDGRLKDDECEKVGRNLYVKVAAMKRVFGDLRKSVLEKYINKNKNIVIIGGTKKGRQKVLLEAVNLIAPKERVAVVEKIFKIPKEKLLYNNNYKNRNIIFVQTSELSIEDQTKIDLLIQNFIVISSIEDIGYIIKHILPNSKYTIMSCDEMTNELKPYADIVIELKNDDTLETIKEK